MIVITTLEDLPKSCSDCMLNYDCCYCLGNNRNFSRDHPVDFNMFENRLPDCPLLEVKNEIKMV